MFSYGSIRPNAIAIGFVCLFALTACTESSETPAPNAEDNAVGVKLAPTATLSLRVIDTAAIPVPGALVTVDGQTTKTTADGSVVITAVPSARTTIVVQRSEFAPSSAVLSPVAHETLQRTIVLHPLGERLAVDARVESTITRDGVRVKVPANSVVDATGVPVTDEVEMTIVPLNPRGAGVLNSPGPLVGRTEASGDTTSLESFFMADITLWSGDEKLQVAEGAELEIQFPLPTAEERGLQVGDVLPAWSYDVEAGIWVEEGSGTVEVGDDGELVWTASVSHLSWWNCDVGWQGSSCVVADVYDERTGEAIPASSITYFSDSMSFGSGQGTDSSGQACLDFNLGATITAKVSAEGYVTRDVTYAAGAAQAGLCGQEGECGRLEVAMQRAACVNGNVRLHNGLPVAGAAIRADYVTPEGTTASTYSTTTEDGSYCVATASGSSMTVSAFVGVLGQLATTSPLFDVPEMESICGDTCAEAAPLEISPALLKLKRGERCGQSGPSNCLCAVSGEAGNTVLCPLGVARESGSDFAQGLRAAAEFDTTSVYNPRTLMNATCPNQMNDPFADSWEPNACTFEQAPPATAFGGQAISVQDTDFGTFRFDIVPGFALNTAEVTNNGFSESPQWPSYPSISSETYPPTTRSTSRWIKSC